MQIRRLHGKAIIDRVSWMSHSDCGRRIGVHNVISCASIYMETFCQPTSVHRSPKP